MITGYTVVGIIPARGGSKKVPRKNIKPLAGKPLIDYTIDAARASKYIDRLILISDDEEIATHAIERGVEWPFKEPEDLADGTKPDFDFFHYTLKRLSDEEGYKPDIVVQLRPTSPLRTVEHIDQAIEKLAENSKADSVRTVGEAEQSPYKMYGVDEMGYLEPLLVLSDNPESFNMPRQELPKAYKHVGYVDAIWYRTIMEKKQMTGEKIIPLILDEAYSGINTPEDWEYYEFLLNRNRKK